MDYSIAIILKDVFLIDNDVRRLFSERQIDNVKIRCDNPAFGIPKYFLTIQGKKYLILLEQNYFTKVRVLQVYTVKMENVSIPSLSPSNFIGLSEKVKFVYT